MTSLELTLLYLLAAVLGVVGCRFLKLPPMLGYLVVGVVIGPNALAFAMSVGISEVACNTENCVCTCRCVNWLSVTSAEGVCWILPSAALGVETSFGFG